MTMTDSIAHAADVRRGGAPDGTSRDVMPCGTARSLPFRSQMWAKLVDLGGRSFYHLTGYAAGHEQAYEMWDWAGPYMEVVSAGAGARSLASNPDVAFLTNHRGVTMARTVSERRSLELAEDGNGLLVNAWVNPKRQDVKDLVTAIDDGDITEMSFAFMITRGQWSPDYSEYRIDEYDINRGDVSAVNYGANPYTSIAARSREILRDLEHLPAGAARAALDRLNHRLQPDLGSVQSETPPPVPVEPAAPPAAVPMGRSRALVAAQWMADD
jgi:HK97 family phage prohead protease